MCASSEEDASNVLYVVGVRVLSSLLHLVLLVCWTHHNHFIIIIENPSPGSEAQVRCQSVTADSCCLCTGGGV